MGAHDFPRVAAASPAMCLHHSLGAGGELCPFGEQRPEVGDQLLLGGHRLQKVVDGGVAAG